MEEIKDVMKLANEKRGKALQDEYNKKHKKLEEYLDKFAAIIKESSMDKDMQIIDIYRVLGFTLARLTTSTYHDSEAEFQSECRVASAKTRSFMKDFLKQGSPDAIQDDFKVSRLMMFAADLIDNVMWNYFVSQQPDEMLDLQNYMDGLTEPKTNEQQEVTQED